MFTCVRITFVALAAAALPAAAGAAELYRWVDEKGVVNYGDKPPAAAKNVRTLDENAAPLSIVPGLSPETMLRERERAAEARVGQLERELLASQARERAAVQAAATAAQQLAADRAEPQVVLVPVHAPRRAVPPHARPQPPHRPPPRGAPVDRTRPQGKPQPPASMRADLPG
jgi:hypothetical protein